MLAAAEPFDVPTLEKAVHDYGERTGRKMGDVVNALRVATTGQGVGPGLYDCLAILGRETCRARIGTALAMLRASKALVGCSAISARFDCESGSATTRTVFHRVRSRSIRRT